MHAKPRELPHEFGAKLSKTQCPTEVEITPVLLAMQRCYRHIDGTYIWINGTVHPDIYWIHDHYRSGDLKVNIIAATEMIADIGTNPNL